MESASAHNVSGKALVAKNLLFRYSVAMDSNPYAAPQVRVNLPSVNIDLDAAKRLVRGPAFSLVALSVIAMLLDTAVITHAIVSDAPKMLDQYGSEDGLLMVVANVGTNSLLFLVHLMIFIGAIQMLRLHTYSNALAAAIVSLIPLCSPVVILGIPFGVWGIVILCRHDVKDGFRAHAT